MKIGAKSIGLHLLGGRPENHTDHLLVERMDQTGGGTENRSQTGGKRKGTGTTENTYHQT